MCKLGNHVCPVCQEEYTCSQPNSECPVLNHYDGPCAKCEHWIEEKRRESERYERIMQERVAFENEFYGGGDE